MLFLLFFSLLKFHKSDEISLKMKTYIVLALVVCALCAVVQADNNEGKSINPRPFCRASSFYLEALSKVYGNLSQQSVGLCFVSRHPKRMMHSFSVHHTSKRLILRRLAKRVYRISC